MYTYIVYGAVSGGDGQSIKYPITAATLNQFSTFIGYCRERDIYEVQTKRSITLQPARMKMMNIAQSNQREISSGQYWCVKLLCHFS